MTSYERALADKADETYNPQDEMAVQVKMDWIASSETQKMIRQLHKQSDSLVADAIGLALVNHQQDNSKQIVQKLIEANSLRKVVETYASIK